MEDNNNVISGLPDNIKHKVHWLAKPIKTTSQNQSTIFTDLVIELQNGEVLGFNKIIMPSEYIKHIFEEFFARNILAIQTPSRHQKLSILRQYIFRIYCRIYNKANNAETSFKKIWLAYRDYRFPWETIEYFNELCVLERSLNLEFNKLTLEDRASSIGECNYVLKPLKKWQLN